MIILKKPKAFESSELGNSFNTKKSSQKGRYEQQKTDSYLPI
jgi:hypothetical protein